MKTKPTALWYHGSPIELDIVQAGECISDKDSAALFALGKVPSSKNYAQPPGWIYELRLTADQIRIDGIDHRLTEDVRPEAKTFALDHKRKSPRDHLGPP
jgi:hypothetical protein